MGINIFEKKLIYVSVETFDHPNTLIWNPVQAIHEHENCYRIIEPNPDPEHEHWQFSFNDIVICKNHEFAENEFGLIAFEKCPHTNL